MKKKKLLLIMSDFYGYNDDVIKEIENMDYEVTWYLDHIPFSLFDKLLSKVKPNHGKNKFDKYFETIIVKERHTKYDKILIIFAANFMTAANISLLRKTFAGTPIVYYSWDSVSNFPGVKELFQCADKAFSFDHVDCQKYGVGFLPLFFIKKDALEFENQYLWDVATVMSFYNKKSNGLLKVLNVLPTNVSKFLYVRLRDKWYLLYLRLVNKKAYDILKDYFRFDSLNRADCLDVFRKSKAVIDCPIPQQNGLTMRTFETLALNRKLITTNVNIKLYDFYCPDNIFIVDDVTSSIPESFFDTPFNPEYQISDMYSVKTFIRTLLN